MAGIPKYISAKFEDDELAKKFHRKVVDKMMAEHKTKGEVIIEILTKWVENQ